MGRRSRKPRPSAGGPAAPPRPRGAERDAALRAQLEPLGDGERPGAVTVAAIVAGLLALANVVAALAGADLGGDASANGSATSFTIVSTMLLVAAAAGMWLSRYWAVLGFQVILAFQVVILAIALVRVEKWWVGLIVAALIGLGGWLFWALVKAMARIQMPDRG